MRSFAIRAGNRRGGPPWNLLIAMCGALMLLADVRTLAVQDSPVAATNKAAAGADARSDASAAAARTRRILFPVRHGVATDLATVLGRYFGADADLQATDGTTNCLLISTTPGAFDEAAKTSGHALVAEGLQNDSKAKNVRFLAIVMATIEEAEAGREGGAGIASRLILWGCCERSARRARVGVLPGRAPGTLGAKSASNSLPAVN